MPCSETCFCGLLILRKSKHTVFLLEDDSKCSIIRIQFYVLLHFCNIFIVFFMPSCIACYTSEHFASRDYSDKFFFQEDVRDNYVREVIIILSISFSLLIIHSHGCKKMKKIRFSR